MTLLSSSTTTASSSTTTDKEEQEQSTSTTKTTTTNNMKNININNRLVYGKDDVLFGAIEDDIKRRRSSMASSSSSTGTSEQEEEEECSFGDFLDAGTGLHSIRWIASLILNKYNNNNFQKKVNDDDDDETRSDHDEEDHGTNNKDKNNNKTNKHHLSDDDDHGSLVTMKSYTAITADIGMQKNVQREIDELGITQYGDVVLGNWFPPPKRRLIEYPLLDNKLYDAILADYLIGAMDGFSPYTQDLMIPTLLKHLKPGGILYIVGLEPIPDSADSSPSNNLNIICKVRRIRDACILLAGHRCYREYPIEWITRQLEQNHSNVDLESISVRRFPVLYRYETILKQINVARTKLSLFDNQQLAVVMSQQLDELDNEAKTACSNSLNVGNHSTLQLGFDYVISVQKKK